MYAIVETGGKQYKVNEEALSLLKNCLLKLAKRWFWMRVLMVCGEECQVGSPVVEGLKSRQKSCSTAKERKSWCSSTSPRKTTANGKATDSLSRDF